MSSPQLSALARYRILDRIGAGDDAPLAAAGVRLAWAWTGSELTAIMLAGAAA